jgi:hypothetical protein
MKNVLSIILGSLFFAVPLVQAMPAQVIIIRHAEKPPTGPDLDAQGYQRANALVGFFLSNPAMLQFGTPAAIYAAAPNLNAPANPMDVEAKSLRSIETVTPLAKRLGLSINESYTKDEIAPVTQEILGNAAYEGKMVLLCWEHNMIPALAQAFGVTSAPTAWDDAVFDRAWVITFNSGGSPSFQNLPQHLLPGDSSN